MKSAPLRRGLSLVALTAAIVLAGCESGPSAAELEAQRLAAEAARRPPPISLNEGVAEAASIYVSFLREAATIQPGGFDDAESIQASSRVPTTLPGQDWRQARKASGVVRVIDTAKTEPMVARTASTE